MDSEDEAALDELLDEARRQSGSRWKPYTVDNDLLRTWVTAA